MNRHFKRRFSVLLLLFGLLGGCEKPEQRTVEVKEEAPAAPIDPVSAPLVQAPVAEAPVQAPAPQVLLPEEEPVFKMWTEGNRINVTGALKSRIQVDRISKSIAEAFPDREIVNDLKVEAHRSAIPWGNRLADEFLVPYFKELKSPAVAYEKGIVTLEGEVAEASLHRQFTEGAIVTFSGELTQDIDNKITVKE